MSEPGFANLESWLQALTQTSVLIELGALVVCVLLAWQLARLVSKAFAERELNSIMFGQRIVDGVLFPALLLCLAYAARKLLLHSVPLALFKLVIPVLLSLLAIRVGVKVLQAAFSETPAIRLLERSISWLAWLAMVLWVSGLLPLVMDELDQISWHVGGSTLSVRKLIEGTLTAGLVLILTLWISSAIEAKLLRKATGGELSLRKAFSNAARALLMFVGLLLALSAVGIDLTALSVLGGAIGVGIGFGLQKLAANYVSGFVILAERSMRIGDSVTVDNFSGVITEINARYTVIRSLSGRESIVPNEMLITSRVENLSLADPKVWQFTNVSVAYDSDVELVTRLLLQAASVQPRVLKDAPPSVALMAFGADGLEFRLGYWMGDPENGSDNLRSLINIEILRLLREQQIEIPFPQRVIHQRSA
ncbi:MAG: mechanosensitive ion channel [Betaproteobacteria bacterium]|nr:mechanosensitive ion channel [Betaproteobacteria bacterium]NCP82102.1 mechanosensitive ion channel [Rhodoferax sp.]NCS59909.1 mechanosensitive ion channel [Rhodoferax sp.]OIP19320.1 MAG: mechanosensitive ion channel protein [Comamonadaceae bacterium CG2_30_57_122]